MLGLVKPMMEFQVALARCNRSSNGAGDAGDDEVDAKMKVVNEKVDEILGEEKEARLRRGERV